MSALCTKKSEFETQDLKAEILEQCVILGRLLQKLKPEHGSPEDEILLLVSAYVVAYKIYHAKVNA